MKVVHLSSVHSPFDTRIFIKECRSLAKVGYEVVLIVPHDRDETREGIRIRAIAKPGNRMERISRTLYHVYQASLAENADVYHLHDPELLPVGMLLRKKGRQVIYDVHEDVPRQIFAKHYLPAFVKPIISRCVEMVEVWAARRCSAVCAATPHIRDRFLCFNSNSYDINNYPSLEEFALPNVNWSERRNRLCYLGGITVSRGIGELVDALVDIDGELDLAGFCFPSSLRGKLAKKPGWYKVHDRGFVDRVGVRAILSTCKVGMVTLHPTNNYLKALPVKMFEYMAAGIPVVASAFPLWQDIIDRNNCGICVDPLEPKSIARAVNTLLADDNLAEMMGRNGRNAVEKYFNWSEEEKKLIVLYRLLA